MKKIFLICCISIKEFMDNGLFYMANALTYRMIMAFFPFLIFLLSLCRFINFDGGLIMSLIERLPAAFEELVKKFIENAYLSNTIMSVSFLYGVWSAAMGVHAIIKGMNRASHINSKRNFIMQWLLDFVLVFIFTVYIFISLIFVVFDELIAEMLFKFSLFKPFAFALKVLPLGIMNGVLTTVLVLIFYEFTAAGKFRFKELMPGAVFTTLSWVLMTEAFGLYIKINTSAFRIYGSIAGVFITIFWVNLLAITLLAGAQLNSVIIRYKSYGIDKRVF